MKQTDDTSLKNILNGHERTPINSNVKDSCRFINRVTKRKDYGVPTDKFVRGEQVEKLVICKMHDIYSLYHDALKDLSPQMQNTLNYRVMKTLTVLNKNHLLGIENIAFDVFALNSIDITFRTRRDIRMCINVEEADYLSDGIENVEVAYLSYKKGDRRYIMNSTLDGILSELLKLLK